MITEKKETTESTSGVNVQKTNDMENINIVCSKHGIINNGAFYIRYSTVQKDEKMTAFDNHNLFCIACLNELYMKFQKEGIIGQISIQIDDKGETKTIPVEEADLSPKESAE